MAEQILLVPRAPDALREAARRGLLIPFIGAGASRLAGCPGWQQFAERCLAHLVDEGKISHAQFAQLETLSPRIKLSIALSYDVVLPYQTILHSTAGTSNRVGRILYSALSRLGRTFVTTNYDEWLDSRIPESTLSDSDTSTTSTAANREVFHRPIDLSIANLNRPETVLHLHGSVKDPDGMVLTTEHYLKHYANDRRSHRSNEENPVLTFLEHLFMNKTVLFIGYGLEEPEILEYVLLKSRSLQASGLDAKHFMLQGYFSHQYELMVSMTKYYRAFGIELLPFSLDIKGHAQLIDVLASFAATTPASNLTKLDGKIEMESLLDG